MNPNRSLTPARRFGALLLALSAWCTFALGADAPTAPHLPDKDLLRTQLDAREKRAGMLLDEIRAADDRIEATIDRVLETLRMVGDSKDSRTKVARMKQQTIDALQKNITFYQQKRASLQEEMRRPTLHLTAEEKQRAIAKFDARIEKRVQQILDLSKSLPTHKDFEKYNHVYDGWDGAVILQNQDYKQNKRLTSHTNSQRSEIVKGLQRSMDRLDQQNRTLQSQITRAPSEGFRAMLQDEIQKNEALLKTRQSQMMEVLTAMEIATRPISSKEAQDLDMALRKTVESLRRDFTTLFQRYSNYLAERSNVNAAKASLDALK